MTFEEWWDKEGRYIDPDFAEVPWFDKREQLCELAWIAAREPLTTENAELKESRLANAIRELPSVKKTFDDVERLTAENSALVAKFHSVLRACGMDSVAAKGLVEGIVSDVKDTRRKTWWCPQCSEKSDDDGIVRKHKESCCHYGSALAPPATAAVSGRQDFDPDKFEVEFEEKRQEWAERDSDDSSLLPGADRCSNDWHRNKCVETESCPDCEMSTTEFNAILDEKGPATDG